MPNHSYLSAAFAALLVLFALPATAAAHPAVYDVTPKVNVGGCDWAADGPGEKGDCLVTDGPKRYVVVNHGLPVAFEEGNSLAAGYGGVINFQRIPGGTDGFRSTIPTKADWLAVNPGRTTVQAHATCEAGVTTNPANVVGWQGSEPFYAYIPWQSTIAGVDDDPAEWIGHVETLTGVDLTGMSADDAKAACEGAPVSGTYHAADTLRPSIASGLVAHEVARATALLQTEIDSLLGEQTSLRGQIDQWRIDNAELKNLLLEMGLAREASSRNASAAQRRISSLRKANLAKTRQIKKLRRQLRVARNG